MEDDPTRELVGESAAGKPADTQPNLMEIIKEVIDAREMLTAQIADFRAEVQQQFTVVRNDLRAYDKRLRSLERDVAGIEDRLEPVETREGPQ